jgi:ubiquinone/menaquinone biosynthesis C-methylase UbiE
MKPEDKPYAEYKRLVQQGYDGCAEAYSKARRRSQHHALALLTERLGGGAVVLDVGCGSGMPVGTALAGRFRVTGVDISARMIERASCNIPGATLVHGDIMSVVFPASRFDAVVAFYSIFHVPREEQEELFRRFHRWLKPGGYLLTTVSDVSEESHLEDDFFGVTMYWSSYGLEEYMKIVDRAGFEVLQVTTVGSGYREAEQLPEETHPVVFARKRSGGDGPAVKTSVHSG